MKKILRHLQTPAFLTLCLLTAQLAPAATAVWSGDSGVDTNWSTALNWTNGILPTPANDVKFFDDGAAGATNTVNNVVDTTRAILSLQYGNTNNFHTTLINSGVTLTNLGSLIVGTETDNGSAQTVTANIQGSGASLLISTATSNLIVFQGSASSKTGGATLDMSGLDTFVATLSRVLVGDFTGTSLNRPQGILLLAKTNSITCSGSSPQVSVGLSNGNNGGGTTRVALGQTNSILADSIAVGRQKQTGCSMIFHPIFTNNNPFAYFRGANGVNRVSTWTIGDGEGNGGTVSCSGNVDLSFGTVDAMVDTLTVGRAGSSSNTSGGNSVGALTISGGTLDVNTLQVGIQPVSNNRNGDGTVNVNGTATLSVNTILQIGQAVGSGGVAATKGRLIVNGGTASVNTIATATNSGQSLVIATNSANLSIVNVAGTPSVPLSDFSMSDAVLTLQSLDLGTTNVVATNFTTFGSGNIINIPFLPGITAYPAKFRLIYYLNGPNIGGSGNFNLSVSNVPTGPGFYTFLLTNDTTSLGTAGSIDLIFLSGPVAKAITWNGTPTGSWNTSDKDWLQGATATNYNQGDLVTFDDTAAGTTTVSLSTKLTPTSVTVSNNTKAYTFNGSGRISGTPDLTKLGNSTLTIANSGVNDFVGNILLNAGTLAFARSDTSSVPQVISGNGTLLQNGSGVLTLSANNSPFTGAVTVTQGTLKPGNVTALGVTNSGTTLSSGGTLDLNGIALTNISVAVSGAGVGSGGAIINSGVSVFPALTNVTLTGDTTFGGPGIYALTGSPNGRWDIRLTASGSTDPGACKLSTGGHAYNLTKVGSNYVGICNATIDPALANINVLGGTLSFQLNDTSLGDSTKTLTVTNGASLDFNSITNLVNKFIVLYGDGVTTNLNISGGANTIIGQITLNGASICNAGGTYLVLNGPIIGSGGLTKVGGAYLYLNTNNSYSGQTVVNRGTLALNGINSGGGTLTNAAGATVVGTGTNSGPVINAGNVNPGDVNVAGTFTCGSLTLSSNAFLTFDLGSATTIGGGVNDLLVVNGSITNNVTNTISINLIGGTLAAGPYRLINYSGSLVGTLNPNVTLVAGGTSRYTLTLNTNTPGQVNLVVSGSAASLKWGSTSDTTWDVATTPNWLNGVASDTFNQADSVLMDDSVAGVQTTLAITNGGVAPSSIVNNSSANSFSIIGNGKITGATTILKQGTSTLLVGTTNDFLGTVTVQAGGTLEVTNNASLGATNGGTFILSGATLDVEGPTNNTLNLGLEPISVVGAGVGGNGAIVNNSTLYSQQNATRAVTLTGDTTFGGAGQWIPGNGNSGGRWDIRGTGAALSTGGHAYSLTKTGNNQMAIVGAIVDTSLANIDIQQGALGFENNTTSMGNPASTLTVEAGATLELFQSGTATNYYTKHFVINGNGIATTNIYSWSGSNTINGPMTLNGSCVIGVAANALTNNCVMSGGGGFTKAGSGVLFLTATNTYTGVTTNLSGSLTLLGSASISNSTIINLAATNAILDVSGQAGGTFTLASGQTLSGSGTVRGSVTAGPSTVIMAGDAMANPLIITNNLVLNNNSNVFNVGIAFMDDMIVVSNNLTLQGVNSLFVVPKSQATVGDDHIIIQYGGTLVGGLANLQVFGPSGYAFSITDPASTPGSIHVTVTQIPASVTWYGPGANWDTTTFNWYIHSTTTPTNYLNGEVAFFDDNAVVTNINLVGTLTPLGLDLQNSSLAYKFSGSGKISGSGGLTLESSGSLTIANTASNDFAGDILVFNNGTLQAGIGGTSGNLPTVGGVFMSASATLALDRSDSITLPNVITDDGTCVLTNLGTGMVTLSANNSTFTGKIGVGSGTLRVNNNFALGGAGNGGTLVAGGATLDLGGPNIAANALNLSNTTVTVSGGGTLSTNGAIVNTSTNGQQNALRFVALTDNTAFGGSARWDIRGTNSDTLSDASAFLHTGGNAYKLTKVGTNQISLVGVNVDTTLGDIDVLAGILSIEHATTVGDATKTLTVTNGATLQVWSFPANNQLDKVLVLYGDGVAASITNGSGNNRLTGQVTLNGSPIFAVPGTSALTNDGNIIGSGNLVKTLTGRLSLQGTDSYTGNTIVRDGRLHFVGSQAIPPSPVFDLQTNTAILDLHNAGGSLALGPGQTIKGKGNVWGSVDAAGGATVTPGESTGTLSITNTLTLESGSTNIMEIDKAGGTFDQIRAFSIAYGGTLVVSNLNLQLANGDAFKLYIGTNGYSGAFSQIIPAVPATGFYWNTSTLTTDGTLRIASTVTNTPQVTSSTLSGTNLVVTGNNGVPSGQYYVLASTSVTLPLANWSRIATNFFNGSGGFSFTNSVALPQRFFLIQVPY